MQRRDFITLLGGAAVWPIAARAQEGAAVKRLGVLVGGTEAQYGAQNAQLVQALAQLGWTEGRSLAHRQRGLLCITAQTGRPRLQGVLVV